MKQIIFFIMISTAAIFSCSEFETLEITNCRPSNGEFGVENNAVINIEFNNDVNKADIAKYFYLSSASGKTEGTINWLSGSSFEFVPLVDMETSGRYIISIPRTVRDSNGNRMQEDFISDFYIGSDRTSPYVAASYPEYSQGGTGGIPVGPEYLTITFSEEMNTRKTEAAFDISPYAAGYFSWEADGTELHYVLTDVLDYGTQYKMRVSCEAEDTSGNLLQSEYSVIFITGTDFDFPSVTGMFSSPAPPPDVYWDTDNTNTVNKDIAVSTQFSEPMKHAETEAAFSITPSVSGNFTWSADSTIMTFSPESALESETLYVINIAASAKDLNGWRLQEEYQARIFTGGSGSLHLRPGNVWGSGDGVIYNLLFTGYPAAWPVDIEMGPVAGAPDGDHQNYNIRIQFINDNGVVQMEPYTLFENILWESFGEDYEMDMASIDWDQAGSVLNMEFTGLSNDEEADPVLFRLTLAGGDDGIMDVNGNTMTGDYSFEFREN